MRNSTRTSSALFSQAVADDADLRGDVVPQLDVVDEVAVQLAFAVVIYQLAVALDEMPCIVLGEALFHGRLEDHSSAL